MSEWQTISGPSWSNEGGNSCALGAAMTNPSRPSLLQARADDAPAAVAASPLTAAGAANSFDFLPRWPWKQGRKTATAPEFTDPPVAVAVSGALEGKLRGEDRA